MVAEVDEDLAVLVGVVLAVHEALFITEVVLVDEDVNVLALEGVVLVGVHLDVVFVGVIS